ncbi:MAG: GNAT family N-acetyltransferase [Ruminococcus sp.]|nr:GNAT family N-acetyltransferase [Ruminococcus sp.]
MMFQDNVLKNYLKNVYFIAGTPCGGKTSASNALGERYGIPVYNADEMFPIHQSRSDAVFQPNMNRSFTSADEFFGRTVDEYVNWLINNTREQLDFVLLDLVRLSQSGRVICDCHLTPEQAEAISDVSRVAFLIKEPINIAEEYCSRPDHKDFRDYVYSASAPETAKAVCSEALYRLNIGLYESARSGKWCFIDRADGLSLEETVSRLGTHFGFSKTKEVTVVKVEKGSALAEELVRFIENCSWEEVKEHNAVMVRNWDFAENEAVFAAVADGRIVGTATLMNTDYYPLPEIYPWVSGVFVDEEYRGNRISQKLIDFANKAAGELGYERTYIPTPYIGLYERFGYRYLRDIVNYGGETDHLYVKEI